MSHDRLTELLGRFPDHVDPDLEIIDVEQRDGYRVQRLVFDSEATMAVPSLLLVPDEAEADPRPAVVAVHGHGTTKDSITAPDGDDGAGYGHRLAAAGLVFPFIEQVG